MRILATVAATLPLTLASTLAPAQAALPVLDGDACASRNVPGNVSQRIYFNPKPGDVLQVRF